jgi:hypothetical protein
VAATKVEDWLAGRDQQSAVSSTEKTTEHPLCFQFIWKDFSAKRGEVTDEKLLGNSYEIESCYQLSRQP